MKFIISVIYSVILFSFCIHSSEVSADDRPQVVSFGVLRSSTLPFWSGDLTVPIGLQHDITLLIADKLNWKIEYLEFGSIEELKRSVSNGEVDLAVGFAIESGWDNVVYSEELFKEPIIAWTNLNNIAMQDFNELRWGCIEGTLSCMRLIDLGYEHVKYYQTVQKLFDEINRGNIDAILGVETTITDYAYKTHNKIGKTIYNDIFGYYMPRVISSDKNSFLIDDVNNFVRNNKREDKASFSNILSQYGYFPNSWDESSYREFDEESRKIKYTISDNVYPLSYYDDVRKQYSGFIHDFMLKLSRDTPLDFVYVPPNGRNVEDMLINGDVDILPAMNSDLVIGDDFIKTNPFTSVKYAQIETKSEYDVKKLAVLDRINILPIELLDKNILIYNRIDKLLDDIKNGKITNAYLNEYLVSSLVNNKIDVFNISHNSSNLVVKLSLVLRNKDKNLKNLLDEILRSTPKQEINNIWSRYNNVQITWDFNSETISVKTKIVAVSIFLTLTFILLVLFYKIKIDAKKSKLVIENVRHKNLWLNNLINSIPNMICIFNQSEIVLYNRKYKEVMHECGYEDSSELIDYIVRNSKVDVSAEFEKTILISDLESPLNEKTFYLVNSEIEIPSNNSSNYLLVINDITVLKSREKSLIEANEQVLKSIEAQNHFLAVISHELRTPISAMLGLMEILMTRLTRHEDVTILGNAIDSANRLKLLVNDILDYSKLDAMQVKIIPDKCNLAHELGQLIRGFEASAKLKGVDLLLDWKPSRYLEANVDTMRLGQIVNNILSNAVKFTNKGFISISVETKESVLHFSVRDTGIGMSKKQQKTIFDPFVQAEDGIARTYGGTGLGMSIVANLVSLMNGRIDVYSELNLGTLVEVEIPINASEYELLLTNTAIVTHSVAPKWLELFGMDYILEQDMAESNQNLYPDQLLNSILGATTEEIYEKAEMPLLSGKVLVVDDDLINRFLIDKQLIEFGLNVTLTTGGQEALMFLEDAEREFDLVITDCHMPGMSGYELTKQIRGSSSSYKNIPVIACTADNSPSVEQKARLAGINEVMYKPYDLMQLHRVVQDFLPKHNPLRTQVQLNAIQESPKTLNWLDKYQENQKLEMANIVVISLTEGLQDLAQPDSDIGMVAHRIKGSAGALGIVELFEVAYQLEQTPNDSYLRDCVMKSIEDIIYEAKNYIVSNKE